MIILYEQFRSDEDLAAILDESALHRRLHGSADCLLRAVGGGGVEVAVPGGDGVDEDACELLRWWQGMYGGSEARSWHFVAGVQDYYIL